MTSQAPGFGEIVLNDVHYKLARPIQPTLISQQPGSVVVGEPERAFQQGISAIAQNDWRGGILLEEGLNATTLDRTWWSTWWLRHQGHLVLPPLATMTAAPSVSGTIGKFSELSDEVYVTIGNAIVKYDNSGDSWGSSLGTLPAGATDAAMVRLGSSSTAAGTVYMVFAHTGGFTYTSNGTTFISVIAPAKYMTYWDDKLYLIDNDGLMKYITLDVVTSETGTVSGVETDGSAALDDTSATFTAAIRNGTHWVRVTDAGGDSVTGFIGTADPDGDNTRVQIFNSIALSTQNWIEGGATAFDMADTPLTYNVYKITNDARVQLPAGYVTGLTTARNAVGDEVIYAITQVGPYGHLNASTTFVHTEPKFPRQTNSGAGSTDWRDALHISAGLGVYKRQAGTSTVVTVVGLDRDHGLPSDKRGVITQLVNEHNEFFAVLDATASVGTQLNLFLTEQSTVFAPKVGYAAIMGRNEFGWQTIWLGGQQGKAINDIYVSNAYGEYRLWFAQNGRIRFIDLPTDITNPHQLPTFKYALNATHETTWFDGGQSEVSKLALEVDVDVFGASSAETVVVSYGLDEAETWTQLGEIATSGVTTFTLPTSANPVGLEFRSIRFKLDGQRGSTNTLSPDVHSITLVYEKILDDKLGFNVVLDISGPDARAKRAAIITAIKSRTLLEYTHRADPTDDDSRRYYVRVLQYSGLEESGQNEEGTVTLLLAER